MSVYNFSIFFSCILEECDKKFLTVEARNIHCVAEHIEETRKYNQDHQNEEGQQIQIVKCKIGDPPCGKVFHTKKQYNLHKIRHGEKKVVCSNDWCDKKFFLDSEMKRHKKGCDKKKPTE